VYNTTAPKRANYTMKKRIRRVKGKAFNKELLKPDPDFVDDRKIEIIEKTWLESFLDIFR